MPLTTCPLKEFLIESKLNGFFGEFFFFFFLLHFDLEFFFFFCIKTHISDRKLYFLQFHCLLATSSGCLKCGFLYKYCQSQQCDFTTLEFFIGEVK